MNRCMALLGTIAVCLATLSPGVRAAEQVPSVTRFGAGWAGAPGAGSAAQSVRSPMPMYDPARPDTFRVVAILIEFPPDDDPTTTGNGVFGDVPDANDVVFGGFLPEILEIPRDPAYFREQLRYLAEYWRIVSYGNLEMVAAVPETIFTAPEPMAAYGENEDASRWQSALFRDAATLADPLVDFAAYDGVIVFHAGTGEETDVLGDSPGDIWTAFLTRADFAAAFADSGREDDFRGVSTNDTTAAGDTLFLTAGVILPESESQDVVGGSILAQWILGVSAHMTGRMLGAPSLFDTDLEDGSYSQGIGSFGIMGTGLWNSGGILPPHPCAWTKVFFGWVDPLVVTRDTTIVLPPVEKADSSPKIVKVPISETEYWLIENRAKDENGDGVFNFYDVNGDNILYPFEDSYEGAEFDWSLPSEGNLLGAGVLIWHVDEAVIAASGDFRETNAVNADASRKGVDLEEADAIQDLDVRPTSFDNFGSAYDSWRVGNQDVFGPASTPPATSNFGADAGVTITVTSEAGSLMTVSIVFDDGRPAGWPVLSPGRRRLVGPAAPVVSESELLCGCAYAYFDSADGRSYGGVLGADGIPWTGWPVPLPGEATFGPVPYRPAADAPLSILFPLAGGAVARFDAAGAPDTSGAWGDPIEGGGTCFLSAPPSGGRAVALVGAGGKTRLYEYSGGFGAVRESLATLDGGPVAPAVLFDPVPGEESGGGLLVVTDAGAAYRLEVFPDLLVTGSLSGVPVAAIVGDAAPLVPVRQSIVATSAGIDFGPGALLPLTGPMTPPAAADLDGDGYAEYLAGSAGRMNAWSRSGAMKTDWPVRLTGGPATDPYDAPAGSPAVADFDGDGDLDVAFLTAHGSLWMVGGDGRPWPGYPRSTVGGNPYGPVAAPGPQGNGVYLFVPGENTDLDLFAYRASSPARVDWAGYANGAGFPGAYIGTSDVPSKGADLFDPSDTFVYPNPVRGGNVAKVHFRLTEAARVRLSVYDAAGSLVRDFPAEARAAETGELVWDPRDVASGVYQARLEARAPSRSEVRFYPIAVLR